MIGIDFGQPLALLLFLLVPAFVLIDRSGVRMRSPSRRYTLLVIRLIGFSLIVLALAGPQIWTGTDQLSTVFLLDRSASVSPTAQQDAVNWIESAIRQKRPTDRAAVVSFAGDAAVEQGLTQVAAAIAPNAQLDRNHTNINAALRLAEGVLPQSGARRIVLFSDGNQNQGNALAEGSTLRAAGIPIDVVPMTDQVGPEVALRQLNAPTSIHQNERFSLSVTVDSTTDTTGRLQIVIDGRLDSTQTVDLH
ncbi:MAG TPA: vWA domain-containing protein, partial [Chloroflexota bacterium]|nr:vWA domain-containing protein [Chloroflexota bacterium]